MGKDFVVPVVFLTIMDLVEASQLTLIRQNRSIGLMLPKDNLSDLDFIENIPEKDLYCTKSVIQPQLDELLLHYKSHGQKQASEAKAKKLGIHIIPVCIHCFRALTVQNVTFTWPLYDCYQNTLVCILHQAHLGILRYKIDWIRASLEHEYESNSHQKIKMLDDFLRHQWIGLGAYQSR